MGMIPPDSPPSDRLLDAFDLAGAAFVAETPLASVWRVRRRAGGDAALKVWRDGDMRNEAPGLDLLAAWDGRGAARLLGRTEGAALFEWLEGPSLGDFFRAGRAVEADRRLAGLAARLHETETPRLPDLPRLGDWFAALFDLAPRADWPQSARHDLARAQRRAERLLSTARDPAVLHGDLHHDNVRGGARGLAAFDPKGVFGERGYDLANAFRNPNGAAAAVRRSERLTRLAGLAAAALNTEPARMLDWAAAKCALSIAWRGGRADDPEFALLGRLLDLADAARTRNGRPR